MPQQLTLKVSGAMADSDWKARLEAAAHLFRPTSTETPSIAAPAGEGDSSPDAEVTRPGMRLPERARFALAGLVASSLGEWLQEACPNASELGRKLAPHVSWPCAAGDRNGCARLLTAPRAAVCVSGGGKPRPAAGLGSRLPAGGGGDGDWSAGGRRCCARACADGGDPQREEGLRGARGGVCGPVQTRGGGLL